MQRAGLVMFSCEKSLPLQLLHVERGTGLLVDTALISIASEYAAHRY